MSSFELRDSGWVTSLEEFLAMYFPGIGLFREHGNAGGLKVLLSYEPNRTKAEIAVDEAWERNR